MAEYYAPEPDPASGGDGRIWYGIAAAVAVVLTVVVVVALAAGSGDDDVTTASSTTAPPTTLAVTTTVASSTTATTEDLALIGWLGDYTWTESVSGGDQTLLHRLDLDVESEDGGALEGRVIESGFQTDNQIEIVARPVGGGVAVEVVSITRGGAGYGAGDLLFRLSGDPAAPTTELGRLTTLIVGLPTSGSYFLPGEGGLTTAEGEPPDDEPGADPALAVTLDGEGLRLVSTDSGSSDPLPFGGDATATGDAVSRALGQAASSPASAECPNGADTFQEWSGALRIESSGGGFISWSLPPGSELTTASGIGLGTTRAEMTQSVVIEVFESSLGTEFTIGSGSGAIRGLLESDAPTAAVIELWAGDRCIFS